MMTKRSKQKFYSVALFVILGILLLPLLFLAGCTKNPPRELDSARIEENRAALAPCLVDPEECRGWFVKWRNSLYYRLERRDDAEAYARAWVTFGVELSDDALDALEEVIPPSDPRWEATLKSWAIQSLSKKGDQSH